MAQEAGAVFTKNYARSGVEQVKVPEPEPNSPASETTVLLVRWSSKARFPTFPQLTRALYKTAQKKEKCNQTIPGAIQLPYACAW